MKGRAVAKASRADGVRPVWLAVGYCLVPLCIADLSPLGEGRFLHVSSILSSPSTLPALLSMSMGKGEIASYIPLVQRFVNSQ